MAKQPVHCLFAPLTVWTFTLGMLAGCGPDRTLDNWDPLQLHLSEGTTYQVSAVRNPSPPQTGLNTLELTVVDGAGAPASGLNIHVEPWMPAHGHGTTVLDTKEVEPGQYITEKLYFNMPGSWDIRVLIEGAAAQHDRVVLDFEVR